MTTTMELADAYANHRMLDGALDVDASKQSYIARAALEARVKELERDAKRYRWLREGAFTGQWLLAEVAGTWADGMDAAVDCAMSEAALTKAVEISQELGLP